MLEKIKSNLAYTFCAFFGVFNFILFAFPYIGAYLSADGESETLLTKSGYGIMNLWESDFWGAISSLVQIFVLILGLLLLAIGVIGLLKVFGVLSTLPEQIEKYVNEKYAKLGVLGFAALNLILFIFLLIYAFSNTESQSYYGHEYEAGISLRVGEYLALILSIGAAVALKLLAEKIPQGTPVESVEYVCTQCGKKAKASDNFCGACGGAVEKRVKLPTESVCTQCGKKAKASDKFCSACGGVVEQRVKHSAEYACSKCGAVAKQGEKFCIHCGGTIEEKTSETTNANA